MHDKRLTKLQGYNAQAAVSCDGQIILAAEVSARSPDFGHLAPVLDAALRDLARPACTSDRQTVLADAGYWHREQTDQIVAAGTQVLIPPQSRTRDTTTAGVGHWPLRVHARGAGQPGRQHALSPARAIGRADLRADQAQPRLSTVPTTRPSRRPVGMAADHRHPQPPQAPPALDRTRHRLTTGAGARTLACRPAQRRRPSDLCPTASHGHDREVGADRRECLGDAAITRPSQPRPSGLLRQTAESAHDETILLRDRTPGLHDLRPSASTYTTSSDPCGRVSVRPMRPLRLHLKPGVKPRGAVGALTEVIRAGKNVVASVSGGTLIGPGAIPLAEAYVVWVENVEGQLNALSLDLDLIDALHTSRYWRIRQLHEEPIRPVALVQAEVDRQTRWLEVLLDDLQQRIDRAGASPGSPVVIDTNVLLEFMPPTQIDWPSVLSASTVRLVVPLRVIEELDILKFDRRRPDRADRARRILPQLAAALGDGGAPGALRQGTTIEVTSVPAPRTRPADADEEVLQTCEELQQFGSEAVTLISADTAIRLRAQGLQILAIPMPSQYSRAGTENASN